MLDLKAIEALAEAFTVRLEGSETSHQRDRDMKDALAALLAALRETREALRPFTEPRSWYEIKDNVERATVVLAKVGDE